MKSDFKSTDEIGEIENKRKDLKTMQKSTKIEKKQACLFYFSILKIFLRKAFSRLFPETFLLVV